MKAWVFDRDAFGAPPDGVTLCDEPGDDVEFAVVRGSKPDLGAMASLKVVQVLSAGVDWIAPRVPEGVTLCSARGARDRAMAEWVLAAVLADAKQALTVARGQARREWPDLENRDVAGLRVLIVGHGSIGRACEELLTAFGCEVTGVARTARDGVRGIDDLDTLLTGSDVVVNLLPLTDATRGLFGERELRLMPEGSLYVNAGRGATTDTDALVAVLQSGHLRAVLDVVEPEPRPEDHPLWRAPGVIICPHRAGDTPGAERAAWALARAQMARMVAGEPLQNVVRHGY
ncbi:MAG: NAD(P)-dependent oxidoreductase [Polyangia bacterium]